MTSFANQVGNMFQMTFAKLQQADSSDFGMLAVTVIVCVWYVNRYLGD